MARVVGLALLFLGAVACVHAGQAPGSWTRAGDALGRIWQDGAGDFYLPFHTHHLRFAHDRAQIDGYQEDPDRPLGRGMAHCP